MNDYQLGAFLSERAACEVAQYWRYSRGDTVVINYCPIFRDRADWERNL
ncbi:hypothetical protein [Tsukamurella paurometabola]|uniref:Uncharacterized protein n=1 Tax=Tsukamurella paurometabola TaxID=2061 RepID=A0A3P8L6C0_TSUPA|nr:hypothetical protein [Tsukamurella paurometabola]UEA85707.1 hypothetical protein LK411_14755 [Tsukamurella paurometabola]VDR38661.1 Uncharacterised protein [Tsukamurella paurometabola]